jgi:hypothetical protein
MNELRPNRCRRRDAIDGSYIYLSVVTLSLRMRAPAVPPRGVKLRKGVLQRGSTWAVFWRAGLLYHLLYYSTLDCCIIYCITFGIPDCLEYSDCLRWFQR